MLSAPLAIPDRTSDPLPSSSARPVEDPRERPRVRLRLKPKAPTAGWVDGGWWPRSRDLAAELPGLLSVLGVRMGHIERVSYHLGEWGPTLHKISCGGGLVRLEGYRSQHANTMDVLAPGQRITLLVVAPEASAPSAHAVLMAAGRRGNTDDIGTLLRSRPIATEVLGSTDGQGEAHCAVGMSTGDRVIVADEKVRPQRQVGRSERRPVAQAATMTRSTQR
jgi:hypothetical protein